MLKETPDGREASWSSFFAFSFQLFSLPLGFCVDSRLLHDGPYVIGEESSSDRWK